MTTPVLAQPKLHIGGTLIPGEHLYIKRPADDLLLKLLRQGEYCNVLTSRQMGKSSLMMQAAVLLSAEGLHVATPDVSLLGSPTDADSWYQGLLEEIALEFSLDVDVEAWWRQSKDSTPNQRLLRFFREEVAAKLPGQIIIFLDEIDSTLKLPYTDDFFTAIRAMYNQRSKVRAYRCITFCLVGVATPNELIKDKRTTPYNIGKTIELEDFDSARDDLRPLFRVVSDDDTKGKTIVRAVFEHTGGHPYLTAMVCEKLVERGLRAPDDVEGLISELFVGFDEIRHDAHFDQVLRFIDERVEDKLVTLRLYRSICNGEAVHDQTSPAHIALKLAGIVKRDRRGMLVVRNPIYYRLFTDEWAVRTAESDTKSQIELAGWKKAAEINVQTLREVPDAYEVAFSQYQSLCNNPVFDKREANELWAQFFERRALRDEQLEHRDQALLWWARALSVVPDETRARAIGQLLSADYPQLRMTLRHEATVRSVAFSPDGRTLLTGSDDRTARLWDAATGQPRAALRHEATVRSVAFSPDGRTLLTGSDDRTARLWDAATGQPRAALRHEAAVGSVAFSPDGGTLLTGSNDGTARLWDTVTRQPRAALRHGTIVMSVAFSPDGGTLLTGSNDGVRLWDAATGQLRAALRHEAAVGSVAFSPDGGTLLTGSNDGTARLWDTVTGQPLVSLRHEAAVGSVAFSPDGSTLLTGSDDVARLWDAATGQLLVSLRHEAAVGSVAFSPDGGTLLTGSDDGTARLWDTATGQPRTRLHHEVIVGSVAFSPDGGTFLTGSDDGAQLWDTVTGQLLVSLRHEAAVGSVAFSPDGGTLLTGSDDGAQLWDTVTGQLLVSLRHEAAVGSVAFSPDGGTLLTGSDDGAQLWDTVTGQLLVSLRHEAAVGSVAFSPDGGTLLTGSNDGTARLWDTVTGQLLVSLRHEVAVGSVAFSPDGGTLLTGSNDGTARLWDTVTGQLLVSLRHEVAVGSVAFSPDGCVLLTATQWWLHTWRKSGEEWRPFAHRFLPGSMKWDAKFFFLDSAAAQVRAALGVSGDALHIVTIRLDGYNAEPIQGDPKVLLEEWQKRLGLRINEAGEIVPAPQ